VVENNGYIRALWPFLGSRPVTISTSSPPSSTDFSPLWPLHPIFHTSTSTHPHHTHTFHLLSIVFPPLSTCKSSSLHAQIIWKPPRPSQHQRTPCKTDISPCEAEKIPPQLARLGKRGILSLNHHTRLSFRLFSTALSAHRCKG